MPDETKEYEPDYAQNREILKNRKVSQAVCKVEGCSEKATYGERSEVHGCFERERCKGHKEHFTYFKVCKWTFESLLKLVTFVGVVMTSPDTVKSWAFDKVNRRTRISLTCPVHDRQYEQTLAGLMIGIHGCGECNGNAPWSERVPELMDIITGREYTLDEPLEDLKRGLEKEGNNYKLKLICPNGHKCSGTVASFTGKRQTGCSTCAGHVPWSQRVPELLDYITSQSYTLDEREADMKRGLEKEGAFYKLKLICPNGHKYSGTVSNFAGKLQRRCSTCARNVPWSRRVPELLDYIAGRKYTRDEPLEDLKRGLEKKGSNYKLKLICPEGHKYYGGTVSNFTGKLQCKCPMCAGTVPWSKRIPELMDIIAGRKYTRDEPLEDLKRGLEKEGAFYKLKLLCPNGHKCSGTTVYSFAGKYQSGCGKCTDSKTEKLVREWLKKEFSNKFEKARPDFLFYPETGRNLELDLFCTELKLAFEIDGKQHNEYCPTYFHRIREKEEDNAFDNTNPWCGYQIYPGEPQNDRLFIHQQKKDRFKDKRCEEEGIYLIRIDRRYYNHENPEKLIAHIEERLKKFMEVSEEASK